MKIDATQIVSVSKALNRIYGEDMPRVWTEEQKAAAAETRRRNKEIKDFGDQEAIEQVREEPVKCSTTMQVTYRPFDGDPHSTIWNSVTFRANVPVELDRNNFAHYIEQLLPKHFAGTNGENTTKHVPVKMFMGELACNNPSFEVDGERAKKFVNRRILPPAGHGWAEVHVDDIHESMRQEFPEIA